MNKTARLRHNLQGDATNMADFLRSSRSEFSPRMSGQNKAVKVGTSRQVNSWFKQQLLILDRLNRLQNTAYESYKVIEREKTQLEKSRPKTDLQISDIENEDNFEQTGTDKKQGEPINRNLTNFGKLYPVKGSENEPVVSKTVHNKGHGVNFGELPSIHIESTDPNTHNKNLLSHKDKPGTANSARSNRSTVMSSYLPNIGRGGKKSNVKQGGATSMDKKSHLLSRYKRAEDLDEPVMFYMRSAGGDILPAEFPYRRREFPPPSPDEEEVLNRTRLLVENEMKEKDRISRKYQHLLINLDRLEKYDPLAEMKAAEAAERRRRQALEERQRRIDALGSMGRVLEAYKKDWMLDGIDPNSEEALKLCEYLRTNSPNDLEKMLEKMDIPYSQRGRTV